MPGHHSQAASCYTWPSFTGRLVLSVAYADEQASRAFDVVDADAAHRDANDEAESEGFNFFERHEQFDLGDFRSVPRLVLCPSAYGA